MKCYNYLCTREHAKKRNVNLPNYDEAIENADQTSYFMTDFVPIYSIPAGDGGGQTVAIIELGGGYLKSDIEQILLLQGLPTTDFTITDISIDGATNNPGADQSSDQENALDVQNVISFAPKVTVRVYFAPNVDQSFFNAVQQAAIADKVKIVVIAWGKPESEWDPAMITNFNNMLEAASNLGCTIFVASGDKGSGDGTSGTQVDYPASSPFVSGVGGTSLQASNGARISEVVWNNNPNSSATGGGLSDISPTPAFQSANSNFAFQGKRGVPDFSGPGDPNLCGSKVYIAAQGGLLIIGGTSAVAPFWGGIAARFNQLISPKTIGFINPALYPFPDSCFYDITVGNNGAFQAEKFWDPCTGNGSPMGTQILSVFENPGSPIAKFSASPLTGKSPLKVAFVDASSGIPTSWSWDFGIAGASSTEQNPSFTFSLTSGKSTETFNVTLTVTNSNGKSSVIHIVTIDNKSDSFPIWAIVLIVVVFVLIFILGIYFGLHHKRK
jgi:kumamolisin